MENMEFELETPQNRRVSPRIRFKDQVLFNDGESLDPEGSIGLDLSETGIRMRFNEYVPIGSKLRLQIQLKGGEQVECLGRVMWVKNVAHSDYFEAGLQFESPEHFRNSRAKIQDFVRSCQV